MATPYGAVPRPLRAMRMRSTAAVPGPLRSDAAQRGLAPGEDQMSDRGVRVVAAMGLLVPPGGSVHAVAADPGARRPILRRRPATRSCRRTWTAPGGATTGSSAGQLPGEWDPDEDKFTARRDPGSARSPHRLCGQLGAAVDLAWGVERGTPDTVIAVLDSGIEWRDPAAMADLATTAYLNRGELPPPQSGVRPRPTRTTPTATDGSRCSTTATTRGSRDRNGNGVLDPEDLILTPGVRRRHRRRRQRLRRRHLRLGLPQRRQQPARRRRVRPRHRRGPGLHRGPQRHRVPSACARTARTCRCGCRTRSSPRAVGSPPACCSRLDSGADVVQEALGRDQQPAPGPAGHRCRPPPRRPGGGVDGRRAVPARQPARRAEPHDPGQLGDRRTATSWATSAPPSPAAGTPWRSTGAPTPAASPGSRCRPTAARPRRPATPRAWSASSRRRRARPGIAPHPDLVAQGIVGPGANVLSADEVAQVAALDRRRHRLLDPERGRPRQRAHRRPTASAATSRSRAGTRPTATDASTPTRRCARWPTGSIPPEADLTSPAWFAVHPTRGHRAGRGPRRRGPVVRRTPTGSSGPPDSRPPLHPGADQWRTVVERDGLTAPLERDARRAGPGARSQRRCPAAAPGRPSRSGGAPTRTASRCGSVSWSPTPRGGSRTMHRHLAVHDDPDRLVDRGPAGVGTSSPAFVDLDGDGADELVVATDDGKVHALRPDGSELSGFPLRTPTARLLARGRRRQLADGIEAPGAAVPVGRPGRGRHGRRRRRVEIVVTDFDGGVHVWSADGRQLTSVRTDERFSRQEAHRQPQPDEAWHLGSAALGDLDGDGDLEVVVAAMDRHVYAWHHDGTPVDGFPVLLVDPAKVAAVDPESRTRSPSSTERRTGQGGELIATPTLVDLIGDDRPEIVVGAQEQYDEPVAGRARASVRRAATPACTRSARTAPAAGGADRSRGAPRRAGLPARLAGAAARWCSPACCRPSVTVSRSRPPRVTSTATASPRSSPPR